ncbi:MAG: acyl-CoA thioesterase [Gemmatimonadaceae bacterium]|jgi:acyl-CoA thioester hydrolase|nr:acyl-CoA thioesterase [Gemmatimonadaceae bacterium]
MSDPLDREHRSDLRVRYAETDQMGVVYHANYLVWCEIGRTDYIRALGRSYAEMEADGITLAVSEATMRFVGSARYDDPIAVYTRLTELRSRAMAFSYRIEHASAGRTLVTASTTLVALDRTGRPARLPDVVLRILRGEARDTASDGPA